MIYLPANLGYFMTPSLPPSVRTLYMEAPFLVSEAICAHIFVNHPVDLIPSYALPYARVRERGDPERGAAARVGENVFMR